MRCTVLLGLVLLGTPGLAAAQDARIELSLIGQHRLTSGDTDASARQFALVDAHRQAVRAVAKALSVRPDLTALKLSPAELDAHIAALIDTEERATPRGNGTSPIAQVTLLARFDSAAAIRRMGALQKDEDAVRAIVTTWAQAEQMSQRLADQTKTRAAMNQTAATAVVTEQLEHISSIHAKRLTVRGIAALAKTELGTIGGRTPVAEGPTRAKEFADAALAAAPDSPDAHTLLGDVLVHMRQLAAGEAAYRRALAGDAGSITIRLKLAEALRLQDKDEEAIAELREVIRVDPTLALAHSDLGLILHGQNKLPEATAEYREAIRLDPRSVDAHNQLAIALVNSKQLEEALAEFQAIVAIDPESPIGFYNMANVLADLDRDIEAAAALREVIRINPNHYNARYNLGEMFRLEGKYDESAMQFSEYLRLAPDTQQNRRNINRARRLVDQFTKEGPPIEAPR